jgi:RecJ-like exonuclease
MNDNAKQEHCPECEGIGKIQAKTCSGCDGTGHVIIHSHTHRHGDTVHDHPHPHQEPHHPDKEEEHTHRHK